MPLDNYLLDQAWVKQDTPVSLLPTDIQITNNEYFVTFNDTDNIVLKTNLFQENQDTHCVKGY